ncbi:hypothetical protein B566_EDAN017722 [Ephemera danica]|nr:hypothetical protein B566_EDAN017722 [Ephemera danica]
MTLDNFTDRSRPCVGDGSFKCLPYQFSMVGDLPTMVITETATTSKEGSRRANYPIPVRGGSDEKYGYGTQQRLRNSNEYNLNPLTRINWRASLVPAAAVTPAPEAYIKVVALDLGRMATCRCLYSLSGYDWAGFVSRRCGCAAFLPCLFTGVGYIGELACQLVGMLPDAFKRVSGADGTFTLNKFECSKQAIEPEKSCME